jgi:hypothetical protein
MTLASPVRRVLTVGVFIMTVGLAAGGARKPPPPQPPPVPTVSLSPRLVEQAGAYRAYLAKATAISPMFTEGASVAAGVRAGAAYQPDQLLRGAIAYGAIVALQDPAFVAGVRTYVVDPEQRRTIAYEVMKDPAYAVGFAGSAGAAGLVMKALGDNGRDLLARGRQVKQAAYDVQHSPWSKADVQGRENRLALAKQLSSTPTSAESADLARLTLAVNGGGAAALSLVGQQVGPPYTPLVIRSLAVAALAALGYADDAGLAQVMPLMTDPASANCLKMSKLNLYQCLAVARPYYEDVFCLGQHIMMDTGLCLMRGAGAPVPIEIRTAPLDLAAASLHNGARRKGGKVRARGH